MLRPDIRPDTATDLSLADYTRRELLLPGLAERDAPGIIGRLSSALHEQGVVSDLLPFYQAALNQELHDFSSAGSGIAFPHARMAGVRRLQFACGRTTEPVPWGGKGSPAVRLVFLVAVPPTEAVNYLHLLASLSRLGQQPELIQRLEQATSAEDLHLIFREIRRLRAAA